MSARIFIDGAVGTTGLQIKDRLSGRDDIELITLADDVRKDVGARADALNGCDVAILCLPDDAAIEAVALIDNPEVKVIDASTAHRVADGWAYGFPELNGAQRETIKTAKRVSNPGCYAVASISILHPLVASGVIDAARDVTINAISGYTGGGKSLIEGFESGDDQDTPFFVYGLTLHHKHVPEITHHSHLAQRPVFVPSVGHYAQGMIVQTPLQGIPAATVHDALTAHYAGERFVTVASLEETSQMTRLEPQALNGTNELRLHVFEGEGMCVVMALLDNLGKGASGSCVQNLNIMLGLDEAAGL